MGLSLRIDDRALIPRPETEEMTEEILARFRDKKSLNVLDLGTGSGAIAIALARFLVEPSVTAVDKSAHALELARENAEANDLEDKIEFHESDWFSEVAEKFDIIVSNPPYVASSELGELKKEIKDHEPIDALDGGKDGLREIETILTGAGDHLEEDGVIFLEIGYDQGESVVEFGSDQNFKEVELLEDSGGKDRIFFGVKG